MEDYLIEIIVTQTLAILGAGFSFIRKLSADISQENKRNDAQAMQIEQLQKDLDRHETDLKGLADLVKANDEVLNKSMVELSTLLNTFITETKIHRDSMDKAIQRLTDKVEHYDNKITEFYRKNPDL